MVEVYKFTYPEIPPTSNKIYFRGTILTKKAREYSERFAAHFAQNYLHVITTMNADALYAVHLHFYFETVVNATFRDPKVPPSKQAKTRYKKFDLTNRIKLLEDCVRDAISIDDSQTFVASQEKHMDPINPRVEIFIYPVDPVLFGVPLEVLMR